MSHLVSHLSLNIGHWGKFENLFEFFLLNFFLEQAQSVLKHLLFLSLRRLNEETSWRSFSDDQQSAKFNSQNFWVQSPWISQKNFLNSKKFQTFPLAARANSTIHTLIGWRKKKIQAVEKEREKIGMNLISFLPLWISCYVLRSKLNSLVCGLKLELPPISEASTGAADRAGAEPDELVCKPSASASAEKIKSFTGEFIESEWNSIHRHFSVFSKFTTTHQRFTSEPTKFSAQRQLPVSVPWFPSAFSPVNAANGQCSLNQFGFA